jgi:hypothetical protein
VVDSYVQVAAVINPNNSEALHCRTRLSTCRRRNCGAAATLRHGITASPRSQVHAHHMRAVLSNLTAMLPNGNA